MINRITARSRSIAAGRDVNLNLILGHEGLSPTDVIKAFCKARGITDEQILQALDINNFAELTQDRVLEFLNRLIFELELGSIGEGGKYAQLAKQTETAIDRARVMQTAFSAIDEALQKRAFGEAYQLLKSILVGERKFSNINEMIVEDCFLCGYLHLANSGETKDFDELFSLLDELDPRLVSNSTLCFVVEMQQEHATRLVENQQLDSNLAQVRQLLEKPAMNDQDLLRLKILEALCLRRLGERGKEIHLREAEQIALEVWQNHSLFPIEACNTLANIQLRLFSLFGDASALERAFITLSDIPTLPDEAELTEYQTYPKCLNAHGNYFKQRLKQTTSAQNYVNSIEKYAAAEAFWQEGNAPYEWAMLQKNKADARHIFLASLQEPDFDTLGLAFDEINKSLRYRTKTNAEYQYKRSMEVRDRLIRLSDSWGGPPNAGVIET